jgi:hypothetical protein
MPLRVKNSPVWDSEARKAAEGAKRVTAKRLEQVLLRFNDMILARTPVYTGKTLVNFRWSIGSPIKGERAPTRIPAKPGKTNTMRLGEEPRRAANEAVVRAELEEILSSIRSGQIPQKIYLTNTYEFFELVEYGTYNLEDSEDRKSQAVLIRRTPAGGIVRPAERYLKRALKSK